MKRGSVDKMFPFENETLVNGVQDMNQKIIRKHP